MTQQLATEFAGAVLDMQLGDTVTKIEALKATAPAYADAATEWQKQAEDLSVSDQQALSRTLRRGKRLLRQMQAAVVTKAPPGPPPPPPPPGPPPPALAPPAAAPAPPLSLAAAAAAAAAARRARKKCAMLPGDSEQLTLLGKFILRQPDVAALIKKGFNPVDAALMNPAQRQEALQAPAPECFAAAARATDLRLNPFSYRLADDCYPMDQGVGEFPDLAACRKAQEQNAAQDGINKFLDAAYGGGMTSEKMQFLRWMMDEEPDPVALWEELRGTGIQQASKETTVYDQVLPEEAQAAMAVLREQMKRADPVTRRTLETRVEAIREQQTQFVPRVVRVPDPRAQRTMARAFFEQKLTGEEAAEDPVAALLAENQKLRTTIENLRAGKISETEMEGSQQRYLQGQVTAAHAPALQELAARVATLEAAEHVDAAQVQALSDRVQELFREYSGDASELARRLHTQGTDRVYHDFIRQQVQQQIEAQEPSVGLQTERVVESAVFRRAVKRAAGRHAVRK